ncbi:hypothetical protein EDC55_11358 [Allofrancisella inopinata]|uniref:Pyridine nucleotide-disulfide oxidoreductase n=1 Tax=Allofrancisella inopinata TaxID=1085647 RepID=A0AAE6YIX6_9GAMM|nr:FAD-dependent oxidoreductase [Allofrancisella inopinata]QIV95574.1 pyridine nucleotide-disulfide oxidoreductase [Allofrancisella inopinata]TDT70737.1 hypothetical protein EDC55_11358 [Allofrancisella inopinata]
MEKIWVVIGGGVAGITAVAKLLDTGVKGENIYWVCSDFSVGDLGKKWRNVSGNTSVKRVKEFLLSYKLFDLHDKQDKFSIFSMQEEETCYLRDIVIPLEYSTNILMNKVNTYKNVVTNVVSDESKVCVTLCNNQNIVADKVIVAIGCEPKAALYKDIEEINLKIALDPSKLVNKVTSTDTVAVFGSSHSAILILKSLAEIGVKKIINFYIEDISYAVETPDGIINDNTGLKGVAAKWAKQYLEQGLIENLIQVKSTRENIGDFLPKINKAIYSIGFKKRKLYINGISDRDYDKETGEIVKNVYGFGIAYPSLKKDLSGKYEYQVGVTKFVKQINESIKLWEQ